MEQPKQMSNCPVCGSSGLTSVMECPDHFLTKEVFEILECSNCNVRITSPQPAPTNIFRYYKSEEYVSHSDTKKGLINFAYQQVKAITLRRKIKLIRKWSPAKNLLDFGCGTGDFIHFSKQQGVHSVGLEPDETARTLGQKKGLDVYDTSWLENNKSTHDAITLWHVLEHTYDPVQTLISLKSHLADDGILIVAVPNYASHDAQHYNSYWAAYDVPRHLFHFHPETMKRIADKIQMELVHIEKMPFDAYYVSMLSEKYTGKPPILGAWNGLLSNLKARKSGNYSSLIYIFRKKGI